MIDFQVYASSSKANFYTITDGSTALMIECGLPWREIQKALDFQTSQFAGVLLSHAHADHSFAARNVAKAGIDIYSSAGTFDALGLSGHRFKPVEAGKQFKVGTWRIKPFEAIHDAPDPFGFLLCNKLDECFVFLTDTSYARYRFPAPVGIAIECNYSTKLLAERVDSGALEPELRRRIIRSHFALEDVIVALKANDLTKCREVILMHLSDGNSDEAMFKAEIQKATGCLCRVAGSRIQPPTAEKVGPSVTAPPKAPERSESVVKKSEVDPEESLAKLKENFEKSGGVPRHEQPEPPAEPKQTSILDGASLVREEKVE